MLLGIEKLAIKHKPKDLNDSLKKIIEAPGKPQAVWHKFNQRFNVLAQELVTWWKKNKNYKIFSTVLENDDALEQDLIEGNWNSDKFKNEARHINALNLFEKGCITWQQKATVSDVIETAYYFGRFVAYPILSSDGNFSEHANQLLVPLLRKNLNLGDYTLLELTSFTKLVQALPFSEQFFFVYPEQRMDKNGSFPSKHNPLREQASNLLFSPGTRLMHLEYVPSKELIALNESLYENLNSQTHPWHLKYEGILKLSYGAENALGLINFGQKDWFATIPCPGGQTIDDVDKQGQSHARPTPSGESRIMGMLSEQERIHSVMVPYPDIVAHDNYHREVAALLGSDVHGAIERIINIARMTFGNKWSKDIWILRDFSLVDRYASALSKGEIKRKSVKNDIQESTSRFAYALMASYIEGDLAGCPLEIKHKLNGKCIMFDEANHPRQIALCFIIDMVKNPKLWLRYNISNNTKYYQGPYPRLIKMAKLLNIQHNFSDNMKQNVIKLEAFIKTQDSPIITCFGMRLWDPEWKVPSRAKLEEIINQLNKMDCDEYEAQRDNKRVFLGFRRKEAIACMRHDENNNSPKLSPKMNVPLILNQAKIKEQAEQQKENNSLTPRTSQQNRVRIDN